MSALSLDWAPGPQSPVDLVSMLQEGLAAGAIAGHQEAFLGVHSCRSACAPCGGGENSPAPLGFTPQPELWPLLFASGLPSPLPSSAHLLLLYLHEVGLSEAALWAPRVEAGGTRSQTVRPNGGLEVEKGARPRAASLEQRRWGRFLSPALPCSCSLAGGPGSEPASQADS